MTTSPLATIINYIDTLIPPTAYTDASQNGLQVDAGNVTVSHVGCAVDAGESVIDEALARGVDLLVVHHGLLWSTFPSRLTGSLARKVRLLMTGGCSLYASHLPLDGHQVLGNAVQLAATLHLQELAPFCHYKGGPVGCRGTFVRPTSIEALTQTISTFLGHSPVKFLPFGETTFRTVAIVTGSGSFAIEECAASGIDLLLSGEPKHEAYHLAKELRQSVLFAGHYATETFGVAALEREIAKQFGVRTSFIDQPSGI
jgi:dinuclear metal center YbgI/SA1388 family protein